MEEESVTSSWSMGSPAGISLSSCSRSVRGSDAQRLNVMSDVCLLPGYDEASGIHGHYLSTGWHIQILLHVIRPLHEKEEKKEREDEETGSCKTGEEEPTGSTNL
ncbi:hypothetical protein ABVT39_009288 [Epinephelus coioides]